MLDRDLFRAAVNGSVRSGSLQQPGGRKSRVADFAAAFGALRVPRRLHVLPRPRHGARPVCLDLAGDQGGERAGGQLFRQRGRTTTVSPGDFVLNVTGVERIRLDLRVERRPCCSLL